ncbi:uncharacterized protein L201_000988 [Kwoniella dendrophila CBS 6074]|uniref:FAD/NAD(P)-binding domain-containing protein n=1 Tax=Kwoniella dendrophila CBS 6074 TaxID=1295534 RepID=A0AAX4JL37_9TREE
MPSWNQTEQEFIESLRQSQREIYKAKKILVIGGGAVGVEIAGEIAAHHAEKSVTLVHKDYGLLSPTPFTKVNEKLQKGGMDIHSYSSPPTDPRLSIDLQNLCKKLGIKTILNVRVFFPSSDKNTEVKWDGKFGLQDELVTVRLKSGDSIKADYIHCGCGMKPNSNLVGEIDQNALDGDLIRVNEYLKVNSTSKVSILNNNHYYAIGDVCSCPGFKVGHTAFASAAKTASNIINEIKGRTLSKYNPGFISGLNLPLGPNEGAGMATFGWLGTWVFGSRLTNRARGKDAGTEKYFAGRFKGDNKPDMKVDF